MAKKRFSAEQIVTLLCQIEVMTAWGKPVPAARREAGFRSRATAAGARSTAGSAQIFGECAPQNI
jgi:hypothetical protein